MMATLITSLLIVLMVMSAMVTLGSLFMMVRNNWTYRARMSVLNNPNLSIFDQLREYNRLPDYNTMMFRFWVWDVERFKR